MGLSLILLLSLKATVGGSVGQDRTGRQEKALAYLFTEFIRMNFTLHSLIILIISSTYAQIHLQSCDVTSSNSPCLERTNNPSSVVKFVTEVIYRRLPHCYVIQIRNNYGRNFQPKIARQLPTITIDLRSPVSADVFQDFNTPTRRTVTRNQLQCTVYFISLTGLLGPDHMSRVRSIFQTPQLQIQASTSYIFITSDPKNHSQDPSGRLLLDPALKNYEHKVILQAIMRKEPRLRKELAYEIHNFCYFCNAGAPGILKNPNQFITSYGVKNIEQIFPEVTKNFLGKPLRVTAAMALPFVGILGSEKDPKGLRIEGMQAVILKAIAKVLNFTIILENTSKGFTGTRLPNGTWTGTIGEVLYGRSDIGLNAAPNADRHAVADFSVAAFYGFLVLVSTKPSPFFEWKAIVYPFEPGAWLGISLSTAMTVLAYRLFLHHGKKLKTRRMRKKMRVKNNKPSYLKLCYVTLGSLLEQGLPFNYFTSPARIYATFWFMFIIVGTCAYKSKLFSYLTFPIIKIPPSTFFELSVSDYKWGLKSLGGVAFLFITKSPVPYIRSIGERMEVSMDKYSCIDRTFSEKFVCIIYRAYYDYMSAVRYWKISHKFHVSDYVTPPVGSSWVLPKYSPLLLTLDKFTFAQFEMGLSGSYLEHYIKEMALRSRALAQASTDANDQFEMNTEFKRHTQLEKPLEFVNVYASFLVLLFGLGISAGLLAAEILRYKSRKKRSEIAARRLRILRMTFRFHFMRQRQLQKRSRLQQLQNSTRLLYAGRDDAINVPDNAKIL